MFTWKRLFLAIVSILILALLFITLILPGMIIDRASRWVIEETGRSLEIGSISINPFNLSVEIRDLDLSDTDQTKSFIAWDLLRVSLSAASIYHRAPVVDQFRLEQPRIHLEKLTADRFNFSDLLPETGSEPSTDTTGEAARFSINDISISGGQVDLVDSSLDQQVHHVIRDLTLVLPSIGNFPFMIDDPARPLFQAVVNDAPIHIEGTVKPFTNSQEMQLKLALDEIDLPFYLGYVPVDLPVVLRNGKINLNLDVLYRLSAETGAELELKGKVDLISLDIWDKQQEKLFFLPLMQVEIAPSQPLKKEIHLTNLRIYNLEVQLKRDQQGAWNHARMAAAETEESKNSDELVEEEEAPSPFKLLIDSANIHDGVIYFEDALPAGGFKSLVREINIDIRDFALAGTNATPFAISLETDRNETIKGKGNFLLDPFGLVLHTELHNIQLEAYEPYYQDIYNQPLGGTLGIEASLLVNQEHPLLISDGKIMLRNFYSAFNDSEGARIDQLDISGLSFSLVENHLELDTLSSADARLNFSRDDQGQWSFMSQNFPILAKLSESSKPEEAPKTQQQGPDFSYHIGDLTFTNWAIDVHDRLPAAPARIEVDELSLNISNLTAPQKAKSPFTLAMTLQHKGRLEMKGTTSLADQETFVATTLKNFPLASLAPYVAEQANLILADGALNARLDTSIIPAENAMQVSYEGDVGIARMHLLDGTQRKDLLKWDSLQIAGIKGEAAPFSLTITSITLSDYFAKVLIDEESRLNLAEVFNKESAEDTEQGELPLEQVETVPGTEPAAAPDIRIDKVVLQGGHVDFTDRSLPRPFQADMRELGGLIEGLSSATDARARVDLRGHLRNQSPLNITGAINPLAEELFLDLELNFQDIEMSPFSPYSGNFVGYLIEKGKLNLTLDYLIENKQLKASNKVFLDQFSFGEEVESANATKLPVKLAVALLKNGKGEIHLDIPVYGSLDDPQFSIGGVIWTVIKNLLIKAASSPLSLLGALVGGGDEDFSNVAFDYGAARLSDIEKDKLQRMAQALLERPALEVEVSAFIDPENDPEGYRREQLSMQVKRLKYLDLVKDGQLPEGTREEDVAVPAEEYPEYLWKVYSDADFPKPRNFIGMTKKLPEAEMEKLIYANTAVSEDHLAALAQERALVVQNFLIEVCKLGRERIFLKEANIESPPASETLSRARVELGATVR